MVHIRHVMRTLFLTALAFLLCGVFAAAESGDMVADAETLNATGKEVENAPKIRDYSIRYILNHYNVFVSGDYTGTHVVGPVVIGGSQSRSNGRNVSFGGLSFGGTYSAKDPSFFGKVDLNNQFVIDTWSDNVPVIFGSENYIKGKTDVTNISITGGDGNAVNFWNEGLEKNKNMALFSDDFVDFSRMSDIQREAQSINAFKENITISKDSSGDHYKIDGKTITIEAGYSYKLDDDLAADLDGYTIDVKNVGNGSATICIDNGGTVKLPFVSGLSMNESEANGTGLMFSIPNAEKVVFDDTRAEFFGHIVAPAADVTIGGGDYNGCIIARSVNTSAEGHMWPFSSDWIYPDQPDQPETPQQPETPEEPDTPDQHETPEQPETPDQPDQHEQSETNREEVVDSGITITKTDGKKQIEGAKFGIYTDKECSSDPVYTFTAGKVEISTKADWLKDLIPADGSKTLYVKEIEAPDGYEKSDDAHELTLSTAVSEEKKENETVTTTTHSISIDGKNELEIVNTAKSQPSDKDNTVDDKTPTQPGDTDEGSHADSNKDNTVDDTTPTQPDDTDDSAHTDSDESHQVDDTPSAKPATSSDKTATIKNTTDKKSSSVAQTTDKKETGSRATTASSAPKTGDSSDIRVQIAMAAGAMLCFIYLFIRRRKAE